MKDFEVWKSYIDALVILTNQYSEPFDIKVLEAKDDSSVVCRYSDDNQKDKIFEGLLKVFPSLKKENVHYQENYLLYPSSESINTSEIDALKTFAESNHFKFSAKPAFFGTFKYNRTPLINFLKQHVVKEEEQPREKSLIHHIRRYYPGSTYKEKNNFLAKKSMVKQDLGKTQFFTLDELKHIDSELETNQEVFREDTLGAISKIDISESFVNKQFDFAVKYLKEKIGLSPFKVEDSLNKFT